jgi:DNA modification methylase
MNWPCIRPSKPVALVVDAIKDCSRRAEIVYDPFVGSGTTIIAAQKSRRVARAIEIDLAYVDVAIRRWQKLTGEQAVHASTDQSFSEITAERSRQPQQINDALGSEEVR